ncbi:hypothetical protein MBLNU459_g0060t1 [Dothideomycetes sp. NU459]
MAGSEEHDSRGYQAVTVSIVATALAMLIVIARIWTRARSMGSEDWTILVSFTFSVTLTVLIGIEVIHGQGRHYNTISASEMKSLYKAFWASVPVYQAALSITKISILLQYFRVFVGQNIRRGTIILMAITVIYGIWSVCSTAFSCAPISYFWDKDIPGGRCLNLNAIWFSNASLNIVTDVAIFVLPIPVLSELHLPKRQKWGLMGVFALGAFVCLTSILRLRALYDLSASQDVTWNNGPAAYWSSLEVNIGIICASLPTLRKTISRFLPRVFSSNSRSGNMNNSGVPTSGFRRFPGPASHLATHISTVHDDGQGQDDPMTRWDSKLIGVELKPVRDDDESRAAEVGGIRVMTVTTQQVAWERQDEARSVVEDDEHSDARTEKRVRESV